jgi:hypothetical protein
MIGVAGEPGAVFATVLRLPRPIPPEVHVSAATTTWRRLFEVERRNRNDESAIVAIVPDAAVLDVEGAWYDGPAPAGDALLIWTEERVYFSINSDGAEWLGSAPRNPGTPAAEQR